MTDKEHEIPVKVVDRRWWAQADAAASGADYEKKLAKPSYVEQLEQQLADKDKLLQETLAKYRQAAGEFEESRLRLRREISKDVERGRREILSELLDVVDNLDRAIDSATTSTGQRVSADALLQGIEMVRRQFLGKLESLGVSRISAAGEVFDPALHEAVTTVPVTSADQDSRIVGVVRHGYRVGDDVLRPASVAVGKAG